MAAEEQRQRSAAARRRARQARAETIDWERERHNMVCCAVLGFDCEEVLKIL
jgi:hypothetical protein